MHFLSAGKANGEVRSAPTGAKHMGTNPFAPSGESAPEQPQQPVTQEQFDWDDDGSGIAPPVVTFPDETDASNTGADEADADNEPQAAAADASETSTEQEAIMPAARDRRGRGQLEGDIKRVLDSVAAGTVQVDGPLTPHRVANLVKEVEQLDDKPSTGAVAATFDRWKKVGAVVLSEKPTAFVEFTQAAKDRGIEALKAEAKAAAKQAAQS